MTLPRAVGLGALAVVGLLAAAEPSPSGPSPPEPAGLWTGPAHGSTPATLRGAAVLDLAGLERRLARDHPVLIDVAAADRRPPNLAPGAAWLPEHRTIPGAVWLPGAGAAPLAPAEEARFFARIDDLTRGDRGGAIITFCHEHCWASWNAAKRLVIAGYRRVSWFPQGVDGWREANPTVVVDPAW